MTNNNYHSDIIIVGAGVLGISLAYHLSKYSVSTLVLEKEILPCMHASAKNAGMIRQLYRNETLTEWAERSILSWDEHIHQNFFNQSGSIIVGRQPPTHHPHLFENISLKNNIPAVYTKTDGVLESERYVQYLKQSALASSYTKIRTQAHVLEIENSAKGTWDIFLNNNEILSCNVLVNAAGAWINNFIKKDQQIPAQSFVRHLYTSHGWEHIPLSALPTHGFYWDEHNGWYRRKWGDTQQLLSACDAHPCHPEEYSPTQELTFHLADKILSEYPHEGTHISIDKGWHCFRTYTEDQLPVIGFDPMNINLYWMAAFGGFGMSTSFAATQDIAIDILEGKPPPRELHIERLRS